MVSVDCVMNDELFMIARMIGVQDGEDTGSGDAVRASSDGEVDSACEWANVRRAAEEIHSRRARIERRKVIYGRREREMKRADIPREGQPIVGLERIE
jgi:hypothetical protein